MIECYHAGSQSRLVQEISSVHKLINKLLKIFCFLIATMAGCFLISDFGFEIVRTNR